MSPSWDHIATTKRSTHYNSQATKRNDIVTHFPLGIVKCKTPNMVIARVDVSTAILSRDPKDMKERIIPAMIEAFARSFKQEGRREIVN